MSRNLLGLCLAAILVFNTGQGCLSTPGSTNDPSGAVEQNVMLFTDSDLLWDSVWLCGDDDPTNIIGEQVSGGGSADGLATIVDDAGNNAPMLSCQVSAPAGVDSFAVKTCTIRSVFEVIDNPDKISPAASGKLVCDVSHLGTFQGAHAYTVEIELSIHGDQSVQTYDTSVDYCLQTTVPAVQCNQPYQAKSEEMKIDNLVFEMGERYNVDLSLTTSIQGSSTETAWGGNIEVDLLVDKIEVVFD